MKTIAMRRGSVMIVKLSGELDHAAAPKLAKELDGYIRDYDLKELRLDMKGLTLMDSSGIGVLMGRYKRMKSKGGSVSVCHMNKSIEKVMQLSGLFQILKRVDGKRGNVG
jgi:hypothetical protein